MSKRVLDIILAFAGLVLLSALMVVIALLVFLSIRGPIFFYQTRPGYKGKPFLLIKFRTIHIDSYSNYRINFLGKILRNFSLDELPQLWNVLRGDMSLVGPRPLLPNDFPLCQNKVQARQRVLPGLTGWAQVNGRNKLDRDEKHVFDMWYVEHQSLFLDLKILLLTLMCVVQQEQQYAQVKQHMPVRDASLPRRIS